MVNFEVKGSEYIKKGFELFQKAPGVLLAYLFICLVIYAFLYSIPAVGWLAVQVISGIVLAGFYQILNRITHENRAVIDDSLQVKEWGGQLVLATVVRNIITGVGYFCLVLPGIYFSVSYILTERFLVTENLNYWKALERSRKLITEKWFSMFGFCLLLIGLNFLGALALGVGLVLTVPTTICALYLAHKDIVSQISTAPQT